MCMSGYRSAAIKDSTLVCPTKLPISRKFEFSDRPELNCWRIPYPATPSFPTIKLRGVINGVIPITTASMAGAENNVVLFSG